MTNLGFGDFIVFSPLILFGVIRIYTGYFSRTKEMACKDCGYVCPIPCN